MILKTLNGTPAVRGGRRGGGCLSPVPFCSFTTLQNRLLILLSGWGVCVLPASIIIMGLQAQGCSLGSALLLQPGAYNMHSLSSFFTSAAHSAALCCTVVDSAPAGITDWVWSSRMQDVRGDFLCKTSASSRCPAWDSFKVSLPHSWLEMWRVRKTKYNMPKR